MVGWSHQYGAAHGAAKEVLLHARAVVEDLQPAALPLAPPGGDANAGLPQRHRPLTTDRLTPRTIGRVGTMQRSERGPTSGMASKASIFAGHILARCQSSPGGARSSQQTARGWRRWVPRRCESHLRCCCWAGLPGAPAARAGVRSPRSRGAGQGPGYRSVARCPHRGGARATPAPTQRRCGHQRGHSAWPSTLPLCDGAPCAGRIVRTEACAVAAGRCTGGAPSECSAPNMQPAVLGRCGAVRSQ
eukprot:scaffold146_cov374-Prasinococcus_capsulatus_cf.AAC.10